MHGLSLTAAVLAVVFPVNAGHAGATTTTDAGVAVSSASDSAGLSRSNDGLALLEERTAYMVGAKR